eukprot:6487687-Amphidinium_carterae.1
MYKIEQICIPGFAFPVPETIPGAIEQPINPLGICNGVWGNHEKNNAECQCKNKASNKPKDYSPNINYY